MKKTDENIKDSKMRLWSVGDILNYDFGEEEWLVEFLISKPGITALSGNPGAFKTWLTMHIALCVSQGLPVFGNFKTAPGNVLVIDEEDHLRHLKQRLSSLGAKATESVFYISQSGFKVDEKALRDEILTVIKEKEIKLVILDSLVRIHGQDENDAKGMSRVFSHLSEILKAEASILFTHHHRKQSGFGSSSAGQSMRGSSDILASVDCHLTLEKKKDEDILIVKQTKLRQAEQLQPFELVISKGEEGPTNFEYKGEYNSRKQKAEEVAEAIEFLLEEGEMKKRQEIHEALREEFGRDSVDGGISIACQSGKVIKVPREEIPKGDRNTYFRLATDEIPASESLIEDRNQEDDLSAEDVGF